MVSIRQLVAAFERVLNLNGRVFLLDITGEVIPLENDQLTFYQGMWAGKRALFIVEDGAPDNPALLLERIPVNG